MISKSTKYLLLILSVLILPAIADARPVKTDVQDIVSAVLQGNLKITPSVLKKFGDQLQTTSVSSPDFLFGYVKFKTGKFGEAAEDLKKAAGENSIIKDYALFFLAESCRQAGNIDCAISAYSDLIANHKNSIWLNQSGFHLANALFDQKKFSEAFSAVESIKASPEDNITDGSVDFLRTKILIGLERNGEASSILKNIYLNGSSDSEMLEAMNQLKGIRSPESAEAIEFINSSDGQLLLASRMVANYRFKEGISIYEKLDGGADDHLDEVIADAYFQARDYTKARELYRNLIGTREGKKSTYYMVKLAQASARSDDFRTAIDTYKKLLKFDSDGGDSSLYRYKIAFLNMDSGDLEEGLKLFLEMENSGYRGYLRRDILWNIAWLQYKLKQYGEAAKSFAQISGSGSDDAIRALYWRARALDAEGAAGTGSIYQEIVGRDRFGYYGFISAERLYGKNGMPDEWTVREKSDPLYMYSEKLPASLTKAKYLFDMGLKDFAEREITKSGTEVVIGNDAYPFMNFVRAAGNYRSLYLTALSSFKPLFHTFSSTDDVRTFAWKGWYPEVYPEITGSLGGELKIDPKLLCSIMREESGFQSKVISRANAIGLMQIIPSTARRLADEAKISDFDTSLLFVPKLNVRLGMQYISDLGKLFGGEKVYVIASYNAGEDAVKRWVKNSKAGSIEEFIEEIPYDETNKYVKKVLKTFWIYNSLYK